MRNKLKRMMAAVLALLMFLTVIPQSRVSVMAAQGTASFEVLY